MRRFVTAILVAWPFMASAEPAPVPAPPPDTCRQDLETTGQYAALIRSLRDTYEVEIARLRARVKVLEAQSAQAKTAVEPPTGVRP